MNRIIKKDDLFCPGIYAIKCINTNKYYIGSSSAVINRYKQHVELLEKGRHHCTTLQNDYNAGYYFEIYVVHKINIGTDPDLIIISEYLTMIELYKSGIELYNSDSLIKRNLEPLQHFENVIRGKIEKVCNVGFDARYFAYIEKKKKP